MSVRLPQSIDRLSGLSLGVPVPEHRSPSHLRQPSDTSETAGSCSALCHHPEGPAWLRLHGQWGPYRSGAVCAARRGSHESWCQRGQPDHQSQRHHGDQQLTPEGGKPYQIWHLCRTDPPGLFPLVCRCLWAAAGPCPRRSPPSRPCGPTAASAPTSAPPRSASWRGGPKPLQDPEFQKHATQILRNMLRQEEKELQRICEVYSRNPASLLEEQIKGAQSCVTQL